MVVFINNNNMLIMKDTINEELNYIKYLFDYKKGVVISEQTTNEIQNDQQYFKLLTNNGFKIPTEQEAKEFFKPATFTISKYFFVYINQLTMAYTYKSKDNNRFVIGYKPKFSPIEDKEYPSETSLIEYPLSFDIIKKYITNPRKVDTSWDLNSIIRSIDKLRNIWGPEPPKYPEGFIILKNNVPVTAGSNKPLDQSVKDKINNLSKETIEDARKQLETLPTQEKQKQITSFKYGNTYNNIVAYIDSVEQEGKNLKLIS